MNKVDSFDSETSPFFKKKLSTPEGKKAYIEEGFQRVRLGKDERT